MIKKELKESIRSAYKYLVDKSEEKILQGGRVEPHVYAVLIEKENMLILPISLEEARDSEERRLLTGKIAEFLAKRGSDVAMFFSIFEAWGSKVEKGTEEKDLPRPSQDPKRCEMLTSSAIEEDGSTAIIFLEIKREKEKITLIPWSEIEELGSIVFRKKGEKIKGDFEMKDSILEVAWETFRRKKKQGEMQLKILGKSGVISNTLDK